MKLKTEATLEMSGKSCGFSSWYCRTEFLDFNLPVIKKLSYVNPDSIRVERVDHIYSHIVAQHK